MVGRGPAFPSEAWCRKAIALFNEDPEAADAARGWEGDFGVVFDAGDRTLAVRVGAPVGGKLPEPEFLSPEELEARGPKYYARATVEDWRALMQGGLDPVSAIVQKRLIARGDLTPVIARLAYRGLALRWLARIEV
jgi:putative sterol carrier protein